MEHLGWYAHETSQLKTPKPPRVPELYWIGFTKCYKWLAWPASTVWFPCQKSQAPTKTRWSDKLHTHTYIIDIDIDIHIQYTLYIIHYTLYVIHYTLYIIHYTLYIYVYICLCIYTCIYMYTIMIFYALHTKRLQIPPQPRRGQGQLTALPLCHGPATSRPGGRFQWQK